MNTDQKSSPSLVAIRNSICSDNGISYAQWFKTIISFTNGKKQPGAISTIFLHMMALCDLHCNKGCNHTPIICQVSILRLISSIVFMSYFVKDVVCLCMITQVSLVVVSLTMEPSTKHFVWLPILYKLMAILMGWHHSRLIGNWREICIPSHKGNLCTVE